jgi:hypothetical protein
VLDLIELRYPKLDRGESWAKVVLANDRYVLLSVPRCPPLGSNFTIPARCRRLASG